MASYAGALHAVDAVTYSAPSVLELLPEKLQKKAKKGEYDQTIVNYIHPKDSIGAGAFNPYDRHIGSSYYIGSSFEFENAEYQNKPLSRFYSSIANDKFHDLNHYSFDGLGNLSNPTLTNVQTGRELWQSPRYVSSDGTTIRITAEHLEDVIKDLNYFLTRVDDICSEATSYINRLDGIKKSGHTQEEAVLSIQQFRRWFSQETSNMSTNLNDASKALVKAIL
ncbi:hypothetical protein CW306_10335 [Bacillus sp. BA3]|uniref:hypothetical protein n=1 Tax=Bacillus sp. BA3 TaxID=2057910 RepID=UPI000C333527|nr:hypothetical protein [Bacillus sp. BA3]PKF89680.1 hypothetical protein CW306_10335 [Bacillus sp. BA3]